MSNDQITGYLLAAAREYGPAEIKAIESTYRRAVRVSILAERNDSAGVALEVASLLGVSGRVLAPAHLINRISNAQTIGDVIDAVTDFYQPTAILKRIWRKLNDWYSKIRRLSAPSARELAAARRRAALETEAAAALARAYALSHTYAAGDCRRYYYRGYAYIAGKYETGVQNYSQNVITMLPNYTTGRYYHLGIYGRSPGTDDSITIDTNVYAMSQPLPALSKEGFVQSGSGTTPDSILLPWDAASQAGAIVRYKDAESAFADTEVLDAYSAVASALDWYDLNAWPPGCVFPTPSLEPAALVTRAVTPIGTAVIAPSASKASGPQHAEPLISRPYVFTISSNNQNT